MRTGVTCQSHTLLPFLPKDIQRHNIAITIANAYIDILLQDPYTDLVAISFQYQSFQIIRLFFVSAVDIVAFALALFLQMLYHRNL